jgi:hypothetical protein
VLELADRPPAEFIGELRPTLFSGSTPAETVDAFVANASHFHPEGLRVMAHSMAEEDLRDVLPRCADAEQLHAAIPGSKLIVRPGIGHIVNLEAPEPFNAVIGAFLARAGLC